MPAPDLLFVCNYSETARDLVLVARELESRGYSACFVVFHRNPDLIEVIRAAGFPVVLYRAPFELLDSDGLDRSINDVEAESGRISEKNVFRRCVKRSAEALGLLEPIAQFMFQVRSRQTARNLVEMFRPKAVVQDCDSVPPAIQVAKAARDDGIPVVVVQSGVLSPPERIAVRNLSLEKLASSNKSGFVKRFAESLVGLFWPAFSLRIQGRRMLNTHGPYPVLIGAALRTIPVSNWLQFGGPATAYSVSGEAARQVLTDYGIEPERICVCGQPRMDLAVRLRESGPPVPGGAGEPTMTRGITVLLATAPWERYGILTRKEKVDLVGRVVRAVLAADGEITIVIKRHPLEDPHEYDADLSSFDRVVTVSGGDIIELIGECDVFVAQVSTSAFFAAAAGRPVVTFDFGGSPIFDLLRKSRVGIPVRNENELQEAILNIVKNPRGSWMNPEEIPALRAYSKTDGTATATVASLIERLAQIGEPLAAGPDESSGRHPTVPAEAGN